MGHLVNPISLRLSVNTFWNSNWTLINNFNYINVFKKDYILFYFLNWFIKKSYFINLNLIISHFKIYRVNHSVFVNIYYYNSFIVEKSYYNRAFSFKKNLKIKHFFNSKDLRIKEFYEYIFKLLISNLYWQLLIYFLSFYSSKLIQVKDIFHFNIYSLNFFDVNVNIINNYISLKLQKKNSLQWILRPILRDLSSKIDQKIFLGYKIVCSGRFTRKQIATYMWMKKGSLKLNTIKNFIQYSESRVRLKYGLCGIKIWINYGNNHSFLSKRHLALIYPFYIPFKFSFNSNNKELSLYLNQWFFLFLRINNLKMSSYNFYLKYIRLKLKIFLNNFFLNNSGYSSVLFYNISLKSNNLMIINLNSERVNYLKSINWFSYE